MASVRAVWRCKKTMCHRFDCADCYPNLNAPPSGMEYGNVPESAPKEAEKLSNPKDIVGSNKVPLHLFPLTAVAAGCLAFLEGVLKYGRSNFRVVGVRSSIYYDAARRHLDSWFEGEDIDPESGIDHLGKALACIAVLIDAKAAGKLHDDRMVAGGYAEYVKQLTPLVAELKKRHADKNPTHYTIADNGR
jgi:dATP/dGTP diphosphohydrolase, N-terminal